MKRIAIIITIVITGFTTRSHAQIPIAEAVKLVVKKVIKAIDLKVQRMQNQTIWLQNAQKTIENELSRFRLNEISDWSEKQRSLYDQYYQELWKVKSTIAYYQRIKALTLKQVAMVGEYQRVWRLFQSDKHFRPEEIIEMQHVYLGILNASARNLEQIMLVVNPGKTQMTDQQRLEAINTAGDRLEETYSDLKQYNNQNMILSLHRGKDLNEVQTIKNYYGIR
jgi:hypothetical protein